MQIFGKYSSEVETWQRSKKEKLSNSFDLTELQYQECEIEAIP